jgi:hypothetical protein
MMGILIAHDEFYIISLFYPICLNLSTFMVQKFDTPKKTLFAKLQEPYPLSHGTYTLTM